MYRARDERDNAEWLADLETAADRLDLGTDARSCARETFAEAVGVSRLAVQQRWKDLLDAAGLDAPEW